MSGFWSSIYLHKFLWLWKSPLSSLGLNVFICKDFYFPSQLLSWNSVEKGGPKLPATRPCGICSGKWQPTTQAGGRPVIWWGTFFCPFTCHLCVLMCKVSVGNTTEQIFISRMMIYTFQIKSGAYLHLLWIMINVCSFLLSYMYFLSVLWSDILCAQTYIILITVLFQLLL